MSRQVQIKQASPRDYDTLGEIMYAAVRHGPSHYSQAQRRAWVPEIRSGQEWTKRLDKKTIFIAQTSDDSAGFMSIEPGGYIDLAFIAPNYQGRGVFRALYEAVEAHAGSAKMRRLHTHASLMAQSPFAAMGFDVLAHEQVSIGNQTFDRAEMEKHLGTK